MKIYKIKLLFILLLGTIITLPVNGQLTDSLARYLEVAGKNNPALNADFLTYKAALEKVPQAGAWPDPQLDMGFFLKPMDIVGGRQIADFTLMQMFPWFGTKKAAQTEATHMAKMAYEQFRETRDNLYLEVYTQWYILSTKVEQLNNNRENLQLLKQLEELAIRKSSSGGSMSSGMNNAAPGMSDVLRIQLEMIEIENNIESLMSNIAAEKAKFNALLNRPVEYEVIVPDSITKVAFIFDEGVSISEIENQNPMLIMFEQEELAFNAKSEMDKKMSYPMFGIGLQYMLIGESKTTTMNQGMTPEMNGMDMIMPMFSITLPIYRNKYKAQQKESRFMSQSAREKYNNTLNLLRSDLFKLKQQLDNAERKIKLYQKQEQLARVTYQLVVQEFVTAKSDLTKVIQVQRQLLDYQIRQAEAIAEYNTKVASIQKLRSFNSLNQ
ncbi:MAG: TolC family protein [Fermentimonas sp.]|nr:TolC family protein [Fermentimonas sp.]